MLILQWQRLLAATGTKLLDMAQAKPLEASLFRHVMHFKWEQHSLPHYVIV
jgi:hypothetical protein